MAIIQSGVDSTLLAVDPTMKSTRVVVKPDELTGAFQLGAASGALTTVAAYTSTAGHVFAFRWAPNTSALCAVKRVSVGFNLTTGFGAAQQMGFALYAARSYSASHSGGTPIVLTGNNNKYRTSLGTSGVTNAQIATTTALTAGTHTIDSQPLGQTNFWATTTAGSLLTNYDLISYDANDYPFVLANNEGFIIANTILMGATGVGTLIVNVEWFETNAY